MNRTLASALAATATVAIVAGFALWSPTSTEPQAADVVDRAGTLPMRVEARTDGPVPDAGAALRTQNILPAEHIQAF